MQKPDRDSRFDRYAKARRSQGEQSVWWLGRMDRAPCSCHCLRERRVLRRGVAVAGHNVLLCRISQVGIELCNLPNDRSVAKNERPYRRGYLNPAHRPLRLPTRGLSLCLDRVPTAPNVGPIGCVPSG
jgi:hypothetical protein